MRIEARNRAKVKHETGLEGEGGVDRRSGLQGRDKKEEKEVGREGRDGLTLLDGTELPSI